MSIESFAFEPDLPRATTLPAIFSRQGSNDKYKTSLGSGSGRAESFRACSGPDTITSFAPLSLIW